MVYINYCIYYVVKCTKVFVIICFIFLIFETYMVSNLYD